MAEQPSAPPPLSRMARGLFSLWFRLFVYVVESEAAGETSRLSVRGSPGPREGPGGTGHSPEGRTAVTGRDLWGDVADTALASWASMCSASGPCPARVTACRGLHGQPWAAVMAPEASRFRVTLVWRCGSSSPRPWGGGQCEPVCPPQRESLSECEQV